MEAGQAGQGRAAGGNGRADDHAKACQHKRAVEIRRPMMRGRKEPAGVQGIVINATRGEDRDSSELLPWPWEGSRSSVPSVWSLWGAGVPLHGWHGPSLSLACRPLPRCPASRRIRSADATPLQEGGDLADAAGNLGSPQGSISLSSSLLGQTAGFLNPFKVFITRPRRFHFALLNGDRMLETPRVFKKNFHLKRVM